jgi:D-alanyl-D-alanine carboxypeptidase
VGLAAAAVALTFTDDGADARHHHRLHVTYVHVSHSSSGSHSGRSHHAEARGHRHSHSEDYSPPSSSIVVDGNSGAVMQASNPDALRHPASLTKVMTLYLLFERLDTGKMRLDTPLKVSDHAADQDPTKLNLKPGSTITVEDAIKGIVTRSANDAAVAIAENIGGDEDSFAKMMTAKARALGMTHTVYRNASGLPDDDQNTTARDQATLGRAIQDRFPRYYKFFSTESFVFHGEAIHGHNHLLGQVEGVDGIKTGFTRASGFNLLTSVHRDGRFLVAVVMGGHSSFERDAHMRDLITSHIKEAALRRTAPMIAETGDSQQVAFTRAPIVSAPMVTAPAVAHADPSPTATVPAASANARVAAAANAAAGTNDLRPAVGSNDPIRPLLVRTVTFRTAPMQTSSMAPMPTLVQMPQQVAQQAPPPVTQQAPQPVAPQAVAQIAAPVAPPATPAPQTLPQPAPVQQAVALPAPIPLPNPAAPPRPVEVASADPAPAPQVAAPQTVAPKVAAPVAAPKVAAVAAPVAVPVAVPAPALIETASAAPAPQFQAPVPPQVQQQAQLQVQPQLQQTVSAPTAAAIHAHGGWLIQIGAFDDEDQARQHLTAAQVKVRTALAGTDPFTERVQKGDKALYRARFAGFDKATAESACKELKRSDFQCMALKD